MYDIYEDLVLLNSLGDLYVVLKQGYKKIYLRNKCATEYRVMDLSWVSPWVETFQSPYFLAKENNYKFFGNIKTAYYNIRYAAQRASLRSYITANFPDSKGLDLGVVGSGISPYTIVLGDLFQKVCEYEPNPEAIRYAAINKDLNLKDSRHIIMKPHNYDQTTHEVIVSIVPSKDQQFHKSYKFQKAVIFYVMQEKATVSDFVHRVCAHYGLNPAQSAFKEVRPYSKNISIYRVVLKRSA